VEFKGYCKTVKLFAKHIKVSEQELTLESQVVHFGIGTPSRILKLLQNGSLKTSRLKYVILDWTWRDQKLRRMIDIPEVRGELINLLKEYIFPLAKASKLKIGLFWWWSRLDYWVYTSKYLCFIVTVLKETSVSLLDVVCWRTDVSKTACS